MNQIAFIFRHPPYGVTSGREGLDAMLATSVYSDGLAAFFIDDGIYQLLGHQHAEIVLIKNHPAMFKLCELCDINDIYVSMEALAERNIEIEQLLVSVTVLPANALWERLSAYSVKLMF
jgi:tRNA 2-thiouridine synthesizing protein C